MKTQFQECIESSESHCNNPAEFCSECVEKKLQGAFVAGKAECEKTHEQIKQDGRQKLTEKLIKHFGSRPDDEPISVWRIKRDIQAINGFWEAAQEATKEK